MRRLKLTSKQYDELIESRDWCARHGFEAFKAWYDEELAFHARRRALPIGIQPEYEEEPPRRGRW